MEDNKKTYWKGIEELSNDTDFVKSAHNEFPEYLSVKESKRNKSNVPSDDLIGTSRRDFLKMLGFGVTAVSLAACDAPVRKAIPYLNKPEEVDPSIPNYYASTYVDSSGDYSSILVKTREGRPIKIEPNAMSSITPTGTGPRAQASLLDLYDQERLRGPWVKATGKLTTWEDVDAKVSSQLQQGGAIRIVTSSIISPSTRRVIQEFISKYPTATHVVYDANSFSGVIKANNTSFGRAVVPSYNFANADVIVSVGADFLGSWPNSTENSYQYGTTRKVGANKKQMSRHYQFETILSLTGANADYRTPVKPSQEGLVVAALYNRIARLAGGAAVNTSDLKLAYLDEAARDLVAARGKAVVISGSNDVNVQTMVNAINNLLGAYGPVIDLNTPVYLKQGDDTAMANFVQEVKGGGVGAVIFYNANPVYDYPAGKEFASSLQKVKLKVSFSSTLDETAVLCDYVCPDHNFLEAWNDAEPKRGFFSLVQPTITPVFRTRAAQESLMTWSGNPQDYYTYLRNNWRQTMFATAKGFNSFDDFWNKSLHDGVFETANAAPLNVAIPSIQQVPSANAAPATTGAAASFAGDVNAAASAIGTTYKANNQAVELYIYEKIGIGNGQQANNPFLQEFPDPISRACWGNYVVIPQSMATSMDLQQDQVVRVEIQGREPIALPVLIQPGQADGTVAIAIGYGREKTGKAGRNVGRNVYPFIQYNGSTLIYSQPTVNLVKTGDKHQIAQVQTHHTIMARPIVQEAKLQEYQANPAAGRYNPKIATAQGPKKPGEITLWDEHSYTNHSWGMVIDLNSCIGCGACVVACNVENNIPVVGRQEVINRREMHWLRIDRYYSSEADPNDKSLTGYKKMEEAAANPEVVFQPMLCQHCSNAPCETVCPVIATAHSAEGLNMMTYNRCIGTRYCANNCPYKVRRFNWFKYNNNDEFDYHMNNDLGKMVLNPDVTVRSRGVMEKCTFCVQRIQLGKLEAKKQRRRPVDGEITTACASVCPTNAIVFGDFLDPESRVARLREAEYEKRAFRVLEEINTKPQISYLTKIRNKEVPNNRA
jgi:molybdopterin-containing oxidoreductase family iron-sulfur binding subunit